MDELSELRREIGELAKIIVPWREPFFVRLVAVLDKLAAAQEVPRNATDPVSEVDPDHVCVSTCRPEEGKHTGFGLSIGSGGISRFDLAIVKTNWPRYT